jgi:hypothetical protein
MAKVKDATELFNEGETAPTEPEGNGTGAGWETPTGPTAGAVCVSELGSFQRHSWAGTDTCERCGASKPATRSSEPRNATDKPSRTRVTRTGELETAISLAWMGIGVAVEKQPWLAQVYRDGDGYKERNPEAEPGSEPITIAQAVGKAVQMESAIAGKRIDRALRRTPVYKIIAPYFSTVGVAADLAPLIAPPLLFGLAAARPDIAAKYKPQMVYMLLPVLAEQAKLAEQQMELMQNIEGVTVETIEMATRMVDGLLGLEVQESPES